MTDTIEIIELSKAPVEEEELFHYICCFDDDMALCGKDVSQYTMTIGPAVDEEVCQVCEDLNVEDDSEVDECCYNCPLSLFERMED